MLETESARITGMQPAGEFELSRELLLQLSLFRRLRQHCAMSSASSRTNG